MESKLKDCPECGIKHRHLEFNPVKNLKLCSRCNKRIGRNKFYEPEIKGSTKKRKFMKLTMDMGEKQQMFSNLVRNNGLTEEEANKRVKNLQNTLFYQQRRRMYVPKLTDEFKVSKEKFIEGLK